MAPIDLGPFFPDTKYPDRDERHELALRWFLAELARGESAPPADWPELPRHRSNEDPVVEGLKREGTYGRLPQLLTPEPGRLPETPSRFNPTRPVTAQETAQGHHEDRTLADLVDPWRTHRERYPGWVVAPKPQRDRLFRTTQDWLPQIPQSADSLDAPNDLRLVREVVWRMDRALFPLFRDAQLDLLERTLARYNPDPSRFSIPPAPDTDEPNAPDESDSEEDQDETADQARPVGPPHTPETDPDWDWADLGPAWTALALSLLQTLRERGRHDRFRQWAGALQPLTHDRGEWAARLGYETALLHLDRLDDDAVRAALRDWPETFEAYPFGEVHRAAVLIELGDRTAAEDAAGRALDRILADQAALPEPSIPLQSQESWTRKLLSLIRETDRYDQDSPAARPLPPEADGLSSDVVPSPVSLLTAVGVRVERPYPSLTPGETRPGFDVGRETRSYSTLSGDVFRPATAYLRMRKEGGYPLRAGRMALDTTQTPRAAGWVRPPPPRYELRRPLPLRWEGNRRTVRTGPRGRARPVLRR